MHTWFFSEEKRFAVILLRDKFGIELRSAGSYEIMASTIRPKKTLNSPLNRKHHTVVVMGAGTVQYSNCAIAIQVPKCSEMPKSSNCHLPYKLFVCSRLCVSRYSISNSATIETQTIMSSDFERESREKEQTYKSSP